MSLCDWSPELARVVNGRRLQLDVMDSGLTFGILDGNIVCDSTCPEQCASDLESLAWAAQPAIALS